MSVIELMKWCHKHRIAIFIDHGDDGIHVDMMDRENDDLPIQEVVFEYDMEESEIEKILCEMATDIFIERDCL